MLPGLCRRSIGSHAIHSPSFSTLKSRLQVFFPVYEAQFSRIFNGRLRGRAGAPAFEIFKGWEFRFSGDWDLEDKDSKPHPCKNRKDGVPKDSTKNSRRFMHARHR